MSWMIMLIYLDVVVSKSHKDQEEKQFSSNDDIELAI